MGFDEHAIEENDDRDRFKDQNRTYDLNEQLSDNNSSFN